LTAKPVEAAGGLVRREDGRFLLVHRPRYDDWSLPKGKADHGESPEETALREVEEETGLRCRLREPIGETRYVDGRGREKIVRYWLMEPAGAAGRDEANESNDEVDELRWCTGAEAARLLTYSHDRDFVHRVLDARSGDAYREGTHHEEVGDT